MFSQTPRCQVLPLPGNQVAFAVDGHERLRWHAGTDAPRPFFFPLLGPAGLPLTRMGHPGAPNHDHHRSIWFAHHKVLGIDFWSDNTDAVIRQDRWLAYEDGENEAAMAVQLHWFDGHDPQPLIDQEVIAAIRPVDSPSRDQTNPSKPQSPREPAKRDDLGEVFVEIDTSLRSFAESLELGQTNFGLFAVRVAKAISAVFGDGVLTGSSGARTEKQLFGKPSAWIDYSGSIDQGRVEGITYFDHPDNQGFPAKWHVRDDGWMGASICRDAPVMLRHDKVVRWRYLLHAHRGSVDVDRANQIAAQFANRPRLAVRPSSKPHRSATIERVS